MITIKIAKANIVGHASELEGIEIIITDPEAKEEQKKDRVGCADMAVTVCVDGGKSNNQS